MNPERAEDPFNLLAVQVFSCPRSDRTLFGLAGSVQLIVFLTDIKNTLKRKIYGSHKQGR
jgi:hypothetical protein